MTVKVAEVKKRLFGLLRDMNMVNDYIRRFGPTIDIKCIKSIKEQKAQTTRKTESGDGEDPIFEIQVKCPVCNQDEITCYELRAKSQQQKNNKFLVPSYVGALGYRTIDYNVLSVTVCPRCLLASPDKKDFIRRGPSGQGETKSQLFSNVLMTLQEKIGERRMLLKSVTDYEVFFRRSRTDEAAIAAYRLAMMRANVEAWYEQPYSFYKLAAYALRIAQILKENAAENSDPLREALGYCEEAFRTSNCPAEEIEMQVIYLIIALNLKLDDFKKAHSYLGVFTHLHANRMTEMKENPRLNAVAIDKWHDKAKALWEDRDCEDLFADE